MDAKTKHTAGPYFVGAEHVDTTGYRSLHINADGPHSIARVNLQDGKPVGYANAAYIVRVCNSFPALAEALRTFIAGYDRSQSWPTQAEVHLARKALRDAGVGT